MPRKHVVALADEQRQSLERVVNSGRESARKITRARKRFATDGLGRAVDRRPQPPRPEKRVLDGVAEARLVTLACSTPPDGHGRWTLGLLADRMVRLDLVNGAGRTVSRDTVRRALKKT